MCALYSVSLVFQMTEMIQYWYQAKLLSKYTSVVSLVAYTIVALYKVVLLVTGKSIYWFAISYAFDFLIISATLMVIYGKLGSQKLSFSFSFSFLFSVTFTFTLSLRFFGFFCFFELTFSSALSTETYSSA